MWNNNIWGIIKYIMRITHSQQQNPRKNLQNGVYHGGKGWGGGPHTMVEGNIYSLVGVWYWNFYM